MDFSLVGLWNQMGWVARGVVIILLIMSMYSIGITVERALTFRKGRLQSIGYIGALQPLVATTGRLREAVGLEQRFRGSPVAKVIGTGISEFVRGVEALGPRATDAAELEIVVDTASRTHGAGQGARAVQPAPGPPRAGDRVVVGAVRRSLRHGVRYHHRLPDDGRPLEGWRRSGVGVGRYRRGAHDDGGRSRRGHRRGVVLQLSSSTRWTTSPSTWTRPPARCSTA